METKDTPSLHFWSNFEPQFLPEDDLNRTNKSLYGKTSAKGLPKYSKFKTLSLLAFPGIIRVLFALFWLFFRQETSQDQKSKDQNQNLKLAILPTRFMDIF